MRRSSLLLMSFLVFDCAFMDRNLLGKKSRSRQIQQRATLCDLRKLLHDWSCLILNCQLHAKDNACICASQIAWAYRRQK